MGTNSPVLLVGAQRSGTTALGLALSSAAADAGGLFTVNGKLFYYLKRWWQDVALCRHARADEVIHGLSRRKPYGVGIDEWLLRAKSAISSSSMRIASRGQDVDCWEEMRAVCNEAYGPAPVWGDKYNEYLLDLAFLNRLFPMATWIYIVRDPREVVTSMLEWSADRAWNPQTPEACALKWLDWNNRWFEFRDLISIQCRIEIRYDSPVQYLTSKLEGVFGPSLTKHLSSFDPPSYTLHSHELGLPVPATALWCKIQEVIPKG